jgi:hypothetical protein
MNLLRFPRGLSGRCAGWSIKRHIRHHEHPHPFEFVIHALWILEYHLITIFLGIFRIPLIHDPKSAAARNIRHPVRPDTFRTGAKSTAEQQIIVTNTFFGIPPSGKRFPAR